MENGDIISTDKIAIRKSKTRLFVSIIESKCVFYAQLHHKHNVTSLLTLLLLIRIYENITLFTHNILAYNVHIDADDVATRKHSNEF